MVNTKAFFYFHVFVHVTVIPIKENMQPNKQNHRQTSKPTSLVNLEGSVLMSLILEREFCLSFTHPLVLSIATDHSIYM